MVSQWPSQVAKPIAALDLVEVVPGVNASVNLSQSPYSSVVKRHALSAWSMGSRQEMEKCICYLAQ